MTEDTIGAVMRDIGGNVDRIARTELRLAIAGLRSRIESYRESSVLLAAAAVCATIAALFVLLGGMFALAGVLPLWLAALVIAALPGGGAAALYLYGRAQLAETRLPPAGETPAGIEGTP
ncbi:MAG: phage holin family protein [Gemmatimonadaceae bacterium]